MSPWDAYHIIGVDGGGTGCRAAIAAQDGTILGQASAGQANVATDANQAIANVRQAVLAAAQLAGVDESALDAAVFHVGLAGVLTESDADRVARGLPGRTCKVTDDRVTSVAGALGSRDGALLSVGTGTIIAMKRGKTLRYVGGWGLQVADQASGAWLGRGLLERVLLCHDGMEAHSDLTRATFADFDSAPNKIVSFANNARPGDYAELAPSILSAAKTDDPNGRALLQAGADFLDRALDSLGFSDNDVLCLSGGVGPHYAGYLRPAFRNRIRPPAGNALDGALGLARAVLDERLGVA